MSDAKISTMKEKDMSRVTGKQKVTKVISQILLYVFLCTMALIIVFPFYWMIISSFKTLDEYRASIPTFFPNVIEWGGKLELQNAELLSNILKVDLSEGLSLPFLPSNYIKAFSQAELINLFKNTVIVGVVSTILSLVITVLSAFAFARLEFKGKNTLFAALLATMMIPGELFTITNYITVSDWGWVDKMGTDASVTPIERYAVLIVPFLVSTFYIYLLKQNFMQISNELYLAAKVDGTTDLKYLWKVMIPLSAPTLISITILKMMGAWNTYAWPNLVSSKEYSLITNGIRTAFALSTGDVDIPVQMAAVTVVSIPLFLVFIFFRKYIMKGVSKSGTKG